MSSGQGNAAKVMPAALAILPVLWYVIRVGRQCCRWSLHQPRTEDGGDRMTDYELIMVVLTILSLLIAVDIKNRK